MYIPQTQCATLLYMVNKDEINNNFLSLLFPLRPMNGSKWICYYPQFQASTGGLGTSPLQMWESCCAHFPGTVLHATFLLEHLCTVDANSHITNCVQEYSTPFL